MDNPKNQYAVKIQPFDKLSVETENEWESLVIAQKLNPTLAPFWIRAVFAGWSLDLSQVKVFLLYTENELSAVIPYLVQRSSSLGLPQRVLRLATCYVSCHVELIARCPVIDALQVFFTEIPEAWDRVLFENICEEGPSKTAIEHLSALNGWLVLDNPVDVAPYLPLEGSWEDLIASKNRKTRYKIRKRNESLSTSDVLRLEWLTDENDIKKFMTAFVEIEKRSWKADDGVDVKASNREGKYYAQLLPLLAKRHALAANVLWSGDKPIAYSLCCNWHGWIGHLKTGFDMDYENISAGALVIDASLKDAYERNANEFDFLGTSGQLQPDPHKLRWSKKTRRHVTLEIYPKKTVPKLIYYVKNIKRTLENRS